MRRPSFSAFRCLYAHGHLYDPMPAILSRQLVFLQPRSSPSDMNNRMKAVPLFSLVHSLPYKPTTVPSASRRALYPHTPMLSHDALEQPSHTRQHSLPDPLMSPSSTRRTTATSRQASRHTEHTHRLLSMTVGRGAYWGSWHYRGALTFESG